MTPIIKGNDKAMTQDEIRKNAEMMGIEYKPQTRLSVVMFDRSVMFGAEIDSASVWVPGSKGQAPSNAVDSIELAWLDGQGNVGTGHGTPSDGLVMRKRVHDLTNGRRIVRQAFVPWSNIRSIIYGE